MKNTLLVLVAALSASVWAGTRSVETDLNLVQNFDWSTDVLQVGDGVTIDLKGHELAVGGLAGNTAASGVVTDSVGGGILRVVVPEGQTAGNDKVRLSGHLRLVKSGTGVFAPTLASQTYDGGTEVAEGTFRAKNRNLYGPDFSQVLVRKDAIFDCNDGYDNYNTHFTLDGGTIMNSGTATGSYVLTSYITLTADSRMVSTRGARLDIINNSFQQCRVDLNGHTLSVEMGTGTMQVCNCYFGKGTLHLKSGTLFIVGSGNKYQSYGWETDIVADAGTSIRNNGSGHFTYNSLTTAGNVGRENWHYGRYYNFTGDTAQAADCALSNSGPNGATGARVTKTGAGQLSIGWDHNNFEGGFDLLEGSVKLTGKNSLGSKGMVNVADGTFIDFNNCSGGNTAPATIVGDGDGNGVFQNSNTGAANFGNATPINSVTLAGDAVIGSNNHLTFINSSYNAMTWALGNFNLVKRGSGRFTTANCSFTGSKPFTMEGGSFASINTSSFEMPVTFKTGTVLDLTPPNTRGSAFVFKNGVKFEGTAAASGSGATVELYGAMTGLSNFGNAVLVLQGGSKIVLPSGASKFSHQGCLLVRGAATLDVSALFADGEPAGSELTVLECANGMAGFIRVAGQSADWKVQYGANNVKLVKGTPVNTVSCATSANCSVNSSTTITIPAEVAASLQPGVYPLAAWTNVALGYGAPTVVIEGCPYETEVLNEFYGVKLHVKSPAESAAKPVKIWVIGDERVNDGTVGWRVPLAQKLALAGWNPKMTGLVKTNPNDPAGKATREAWQYHNGLNSMSLMSNASHAGFLHGLETYAAAAEEPDYTIMVLGTWEYWDGPKYNANQLFNHWKEAVSRVLAACPNTIFVATTFLRSTVDQGSSTDKTARDAANDGANTLIKEFLQRSESDGGFPTGRVVLVDLAAQLVHSNGGNLGTGDFRSNWEFSAKGCDHISELLKDKLLSIGTRAGKNGAPKVLKVRNSLDLSEKTLTVVFNKPVASIPASASLSPAGVTLANAKLAEDGRTVTYELSTELDPATAYTLALGAFVDTAGESTSSASVGFTPRTFGAANNVPTDYTAGFTKLAVLEPEGTTWYRQSTLAVPYAWKQEYLPESGITKAGYYIELQRADTGEMKCMWIDFDAPGGSFDDISLPVTYNQFRQQTVSKLHVWTDHAGVSNVAANDDSVVGSIAFNSINYSGGAKNFSGAAIELIGGTYDWNDTLSHDASTSGHGCFHFYRHFRDAPDSGPAAEVLFAYNEWGTSNTSYSGIGFGTLADNNKFLGSKSFNWTFSSSAAGDIRCKINAAAYKTIRIEFWAKCGSMPTRDSVVDATWAAGTAGDFANITNWHNRAGTMVSTLNDQRLMVPTGSAPTFSYIGWDPVELYGAELMLDGTATFPTSGGICLGSLDMGATGRLVFDPAKVSFRFSRAPKFAAGAKLALASKYGAYTKGRFLLFNWDAGDLGLDAAALNALFDASSAAGANPRVYVEKVGTGGRLWLDLDADATYPTVRVMPVGDSITHGGGYGNWRIPLMKKLLAEGFNPVSTGMWLSQSADETGAPIPEEWKWHSGVGGRRLITNNAGGVLDSIENELVQAGNVDVLLLKIGTNDINGNAASANELFEAWKECVNKILAQSECKVVAGAVVNINDSTKDTVVRSFNAQMKAAIEGGTVFPANRVFFADLYTVVPRYDGNGKFIVGSFQTESDLHPDWPGEDAMADEYCRAIKAAFANGLPVHPAPHTTCGCENNVPAAYRANYKLARVIDATYAGGMTDVVPYEDFSANEGTTEDLCRVGYYVELKRKNTAITDYGGDVRWLWVDLPAFGERNIDSCGVPLFYSCQCVLGSLHIASNMPGIDNVPPTDNTVKGGVEFTPYDYGSGASPVAGMPANTWSYDWNDKLSTGNGYSCMQVYRFLSGRRMPAQILFAFNHWHPATVDNCIGLGTFAFHQKSSLDWTFVSKADYADIDTFGSGAYEVAKIEIWTQSRAEAVVAGNVETMLWRPASDARVSTGVQAWMKLGTTDGTLYALATGSTCVFDGQDSGTGSVQVPDSVAVDAIAFTGGKSYTFTGDGILKASVIEVGLSGSSTVTVDGAGFDASSIVVKGGKLRLGNNAKAGALGPDTTGTITIRDGGQLDLNYCVTGADNDATRSSHAYDKLFHIAGAGPDGEGAIVNMPASPHVRWYSALGRVELDADATIGGNSRIDLRASWGDRRYIGRPYIYGPGKTLTDKLHTSTHQGLSVLGGDVTLGKLIVAEGATFGSEGEVNWNIENGVELRDGARLDGWGATIRGTGTVRVAPGATVEIRAMSGTTVYHVPVEVPADATVKLTGGGTIQFAAGFDCKGKVQQTAGVIMLDDVAPLAGAQIPVDRWDFAGGTIYIGNNAKDGIPNTGHLDVIGASTGNIYFRTFEGDDIDGTQTVVRAPNAILWFESNLRNSTSIYEVPCITVHNADNWQSKSLYLGGSSFHGNLCMDGGSLTVQQMQTASGTDYRSGRVELTNGAKLTIEGNGHGAEAYALSLASTTAKGNAFESIFEVSNGAELSVPNGYTMNGWSSRYARIDINEGGIGTFYGIVGRRRYNGIGGSNKCGHDSMFRLNGGTLNIGAGGFLHGMVAYSGSANSNEVLNDHYNESGALFRLNDGTVKVTANTFDDNNQRSPGVDVAFGDRPENAGAVTFDLNGKSFDLRSGVKGSSDVTLTGGGTFKTSRWSQGIATGLWTVNAGVDAQLDGAVGFTRGLVLEEGATARVWANSESLVECYSGSLAFDFVLKGAKIEDGVVNDCFTHYATDLHYLHQAKHSVGPSYHSYGYRGEFYVTPDNADRTWYFYGCWDDRVALVVDGVQVLMATADCGAANGSIKLSEGWHKFVCSCADGYGGQGPNWGNNDMGIGYRVGSDGGSTAANYRRFDTDSLKMRPSRHVLWSCFQHGQDWNKSGNSYSTYMDRKANEYTFTVQTNSVKMCNNSTSVGNADFALKYIKNSENCVRGSFWVGADQAGYWHIKCGYDDFSGLVIDGRIVAGVPDYRYGMNGGWQATEGWHEFEMFFGDTYGGYGPNGYSGVASKTMVTVSINGGAYVPFDEDTIHIGETPFVGLAGESVVKSGATLTNAGTAAYPVTGTVWGSGALSGLFAFKGGKLGVTGSGSDYQVVKLDTDNHDANAFKELGGVQCAFNGKPTRGSYLLGGANGLSASNVQDLSLEISIDGLPNDKAQRYIDTMFLSIQNNRLYLQNPLGSPTVLFFR